MSLTFPSSNQAVLGWDLGGAHLKAVLLDAAGNAQRVVQLACPLWRGMENLNQAVDAALQQVATENMLHAVTMTGELADIFPSRREGVVALTDCMAARLPAARLHVYAGVRGFLPTQEVGAAASDVASANWHASAAFLAQEVGEGLLLDIGTTTSDFILLHQGRVAARGTSDAERLRCGELIYSGVARTPLMALTQKVALAGEEVALAAEHFATTADIYRLTGELAEAYDMGESADGGEKTCQGSARRLARMVGADEKDAEIAQWRGLAWALRAQQLRVLELAAERMLSRGLLPDEAPVIGAGAGRFLARALAMRLGRPYRDASDWVKGEANVAAWAAVCLPAYAVARLLGGVE